MSVTSDIIESWRRPRKVVRRHLARGRSEAFAFSLLFVGLLIAFIAQYPSVVQVVQQNPEVPLSAQLLGRALGILAMIPVFYAAAAATRLIGMAVGGRGSWYGARIALFWALVAVAPLVLLMGMVNALIGPGSQLMLTVILAFAGFMFQWIIGLMVVEQGE